jgi:hypothetical protein
MEEEKYPVCSERNSADAYERFLGPDSGAAPELLKTTAGNFVRTIWRRRSAGPIPRWAAEQRRR